MGDEIKINRELFNFRLDYLFDRWDAGYATQTSAWHNTEVFVLISSKNEGTPLSDQLHLWLFGYVFPELLLVLYRNRRAFVLSGAKRLQVLRQLQNENFTLVEKGTPEINAKQVAAMFGAEVFGKELQKGHNAAVLRPGDEQSPLVTQLLAEVAKAISAVGLETVDIDRELCLLMAVQDEAARNHSAKASILAERLLLEVALKRLLKVMDEELTEDHSALVKLLEKSIDDKRRQEIWAKKFGIVDEIDMLYASVQSGRKFEFKPSTVTPGRIHTTSGPAILGITARYRDYSAGLVRTYLFDPTEPQQSCYAFALRLLASVVSTLRPGATFNSVHAEAIALVTAERPDLLAHLSSSLGHVVGLEFWDKNLILSGKLAYDVMVETNMIIQVSVGFANVGAKGQTFAVWIADTVVIGKEENVVLTATADKALKAISYECAPEQPAAPKPVKKTSQEKPTNSTAQPTAGKESIVLKDRLRSRTKQVSMEEVEKQKSIQKLIRKRKLVELRARIASGEGARMGTAKRAVRPLSRAIAYRQAVELPKDLRPGRIHLDLAKEALILPMPDSGPLAVHIAMVRNALCVQEEKHWVCRLHFQVPATATAATAAKAATVSGFPALTGPTGMFIKELSFKSTNPQLPQVIRSVKDLQKRVRQREEVGGAAHEVAPKVVIDVNRRTGQRVMLKNVFIRSGAQARRQPGVLEAHNNGMRFNAGRSEMIEIAYANIKHAIFQPCMNELLVILHFTLKQAIVTNTRRMQDVQFYTEVGNATDDLEQKRGRSTFDPDEIAEEQREREQKKKLNNEFKKFAEGLEQLAAMNNEKIQFEIPQRKLGFTGVPHNSSVFIMPTAHCLVHLTEPPLMVLSLEDIEVVSFERIYHGLRAFDIVFVFKDYNRPVQQITTVPIESLDMLRRWLNEVGMVWYENKKNLTWAEVLHTIQDDFEDFVEKGGFDLFLGDDDNDASDEDTETDEDDEDYKEKMSDVPSSEDFEDDEESDEDEEEEEEDEEESHDDDESGNTEEEGLDWDTLEAKAKAEDGAARVRKRKEEASEDSPRKKRRV